MKRLTTFKKFTFALVFAVTGVILQAQTLSPLNPSGENPGSEENPYVINDVNDWNTLADDVNGGYSYDGKFLKLTDNIPVTIDNTDNSDKMVGVGIGNTESNWFSGTFDGDGHTLTFNAGTTTTAYSPATNAPTAPFRIIDGATIKNLTVTGTIVSDKKYNSGLIGFAYNTQSGNENYIISCTSDIFVDCSNISGNNPDCSSAGFLAENKNGKIHFTYCIFTGTIKGSNTGTQKSAGFVSYNGGTSASFTNCTMAGTITIESNIATFNRNGKDSYSKAYYITNYSGSSPQGTPATTTEPTDGIAKKYTKNANTYYVPGAQITGLEETVFQYTGNNITITPVVEYYGRTLTQGEEYTISIEKKNGSGVYEPISAINAAGDYHYIIAGTGSYGGSLTTDIKVIQLNSWAALMEAMSQNEGTFDLTQDITADNPRTTDLALQVTGNITLNMNGYTIDRNLSDTIVYGQVIRVESGASLMINGPGTITGGYSWPGASSVPSQSTYYDKRDAGGIHNMGNLTLYDVNIIDNECVKGEAGAYNYSARGGGIYSGSGSSLVIEGGEITYNKAPGGGGGVYCEKANTFTMTNVTVEGNTCDSKGGGLRILTTGSTKAYLTDCNINMNMVDQDASQGAGVFLEGGELVMTHCEIMGNQASQQGAGFYSLNGTTTAINCNISYNGTYYDDPNNRGAGVCLNDNKGSYHSIFIMDGGTIEANNCTHDGGGIYVHDGAIFQVKGNVIIRDNWKAGLNVPVSSINNAYLDGTSVIEVVDELGDDAVINITPSGSGSRTYVVLSEGVSAVETMQHFALDNSEYNLIIDDQGNIEVYESYPWNNADTWNGTIAEATNLDEGIPTSSSVITIHRAVKIPSGVTANAGTITCDDFCDIIIEDGAELITNSSDVAVVSKKNVVAADADAGTGWYLIASPAANPSIEDNTNLITGLYYDTYDLYRFNEAAELQWENYRAGHDDFTTLQNGRGYLYRNEEDHTIEIGGTLNVSDVSYTLTSAGTNELKGFNIIGNPYSHTIYKGDVTETVHPAIPNTILEEKYYVLNPTTGEWDLTDDGTAIAPMTGILVQATETGVLSISNSTEGYIAPSRNSIDKNIWFTVANGSYEDRACVEFKEGHGLNKISHLNEEAPMLYINHNGEYFASIDISDGTRSLDLNFEAMTIGRYTLTVNPQGGFSYLHLIDKVAGKDVDLLKDGEYEFVGSSADDADRFIVRFSAASDSEDDETFAFQDGSDIVVMGEGELQVFDVTGRMVLTQCISGVETIRKPSETGVYILRLEGKTQKILVK